MLSRKIVVLLVALTLCVGTYSPALAISTFSVSFSSTEAQEDPPASIAAANGALYVLTTEGRLGRIELSTREKTEVGKCLYTGYLGDADQVAKAKEEDPLAPAADQLFTYEGKLYGLCSATGEWTRLLDDVGMLSPVPMEPVLDTLNLMQKEEDFSYVLTPSSFFVQDDRLFYTILSYSMNGATTIAGQIDLKTGENKGFQTKNLTELAAWKDGKLLCRIFDEANAYNSQTGEVLYAQYGLFDPETDSFEALGELGNGSIFGGMASTGICASPDAGTLYYAVGSRIMGLSIATGESHVSAYTGEGMYGSLSGNAQTLFVDGYYVKKGYDEIQLYALDTDAVRGGALRIFGEFGSDAHKSFSQAYPDIPVDVGDEYTNQLDKLTAAMVSESDPYDVLLLDFSYMPVDKLQQKGYCMELSQFPEIMETLSQMDPAFTAPLQADGKLYAVPVGMNATTFSVDLKIWTEELGLSEDDLPKTYAEFFDFLGHWEDDFADDHGDVPLVRFSPIGDIFFSLMLQDYMTYMQSRGEPLRFDTELMRRLLTANEQVDYTGLDSGETVRDWNKGVLFDPTYSLSQFNYYNYYDSKPTPLFLSLEEGGTPVIGANLSVLIINPKTQRREQAVLYVNHYLQNLAKAGENITLFPDHNEPVENQYYARNQRDLQAELDKQNQLLEAAEESRQAEIKAEISMLEERIADIEKNRYDVSPEQIAQFREKIAPMLFINRQSVFLSGNTSELAKLFEQYMQRAITQDQFVKELDQRLRMMELEEQ